MSDQTRREAWIIFCLLAFVYGYFYQNSGWNGNSRFGLIFAVVQEGRLTIDSFHTREGTSTLDKAYVNGHYYSEKSIGPATFGVALYAPLYWMKQTLHWPNQTAAKMILTFLIIGLPSALAGSLMYRLSFDLSGSRRRAYLVSVAVALGTLSFPFSVTFFSHQFTAAWLFCAFYLAYRLKQQPQSWRAGSYILFGALLGWALVGEFPAAIIIFILLVYYFAILWRNPALRRMRAILLPVIGAALPLALQLLYHHLCFGSWLSVSYTFLYVPELQTSMARGLGGILWPDLRALYYMTLHPTMGLFWQSPALLFAAVGAVYLIRQRQYRAEALLALAVIVSLSIILSGYYMWWGGASLGPRHIIPMLPFFSILLAGLPRRWTWPLALLSLVSFGQMLIGAASTVLVSDAMIRKVSQLGFFEYSHIYSYCLKLLLDGRFSSNLGQRLVGLQSWWSLAPLLVVLAGVSGWFYFYSPNFSTGDRRPRQGVAVHGHAQAGAIRHGD